jgi:small subunit ribosomal protein S17
MADKPKSPKKESSPKDAKPRPAGKRAPGAADAPETSAPRPVESKPTKAAAAPAPAAAAPAAAAAATAPAAHEHKTHSFRRRLFGRVVSDKMDKTVVVEVIRRSRDAVYKKYVRSSDRYKAHDEKNEFKVGDSVEIMEHRPISKDKRWKVVRLVARAALE